MSPPQIVFAGVATVDTIALVGRFPHPDERMLADDLVVAGGGPAATAAVAAARQGQRCAFIGTVGDDDAGRQIRRGLEAEGIDTSGLITVPDQSSASSVVIVDGPGATRAIINRPPPPLRPTDLERPDVADLLAAARWLHVDQAGWSFLGDWWRAAGPSRPRLSVDAGNPIPGFDPMGIDLYVPTVSALRLIHGPLDAADLVVEAQAAGAVRVVATDGAAGAWVADVTGVAQVPAADDGTEVRSTLGAGDVFHGALLAGVAAGRDLLDAVAAANRIALRSCAGLDGRSAIPTAAEIGATS